LSGQIISSSETTTTTISNPEIVNGGYLTISYGGNSIDSNISSGGVEKILPMSSWMTSDNVFHEAIGSASNTTVYDGGNLYVSGIATDTIVSSGGAEHVQGEENGAKIESGGSLYIIGGGEADNIQINSGANLYLSDAESVNNSYASEGSYITIGTGEGINDFELYVKNDEIYEKFYEPQQGIPTSNNEEVLIDKKLYDIQTDDDLNNYNLTEISGSSDSYTFYLEKSTEACFLKGSMILTDNGYKPIESINLGDFLKIKSEYKNISRVIWIGKSHCTTKTHLPDDEAGYPVRILKDAISDGVPFKDMLITSEHCLFFDGNFVPARMLVNGRSIYFDKSITSYDYYHIETEEHSVIMADGILTESYLDTGNRNSFSQKGNIISMGSNRNRSWDDAAAPLTVTRETVEPLSRHIADRADKAGYTLQTAVRPLTHDSDLHLMTDTGAVIRPTRQNDDHVMFMIPSGLESVRIVSNASRPCDVLGPFVDDRRKLGVLVGKITLFDSNRTRTLTDHLHVTQLSGWNNVEDGTMRWTSGNALLSLGERAPGTLALMAVEVRAAGPYILDETISERQALKA